MHSLPAAKPALALQGLGLGLGVPGGVLLLILGVAFFWMRESNKRVDDLPQFDAAPVAVETSKVMVSPKK